MSLRVLVVGRGTAANERVANGHMLEFKVTARPGEEFLSLEQYDFVFQHLSPANPEARGVIEDWIAKGWKPRIIGFSGGRIPTDLVTLPVPQFEGLPGRQNIIDLSWSAVPSGFRGDAQELLALLIPRKLELLTALAILSQGYLVVHAAYNGPETPDWRPEDIEDALHQMGWTALVSRTGFENPLIRRDLGNEKDIVRRQNWWLQTFGILDESQKIIRDRWTAFKDNLMRECIREGKAGMPAELNTLLDAIGTEGSMIGPEIVANAYSAIALLLAKK